eukprot:13646412-Alexandrium_andersonii.AAC.1
MSASLVGSEMCIRDSSGEKLAVQPRRGRCRSLWRKQADILQGELAVPLGGHAAVLRRVPPGAS